MNSQEAGKRRKGAGPIAFIALIFILGVILGTNLQGLAHRFGINLVDKSFAKLETIYAWVDKYHVDPNALNKNQAIEDAIRGMLPHVDGGYTRYESAEEAMAFNESTIEGKYTGIGIQSKAPTGGEMEVEIVFRGSPAESAGMKVRDRIIAVDGEIIKGLTQTEINSRIRGEAGTEVTLTVIREGESAPLSVPIVRGVIALPVVDHWLDGKVGVVAMYRFTETAPGQLKEAVLTLKAEGAESILFDLRSNGGGLLYSAKEIVDFFVPKDKIIVRQVDRQGREEVLKTSEGVIWDGPLAVLMNDASASASEVVAGALQDHRRAILLGEVSFGKGTVQVPYPMSDGSRLWVTQYRYLTPEGRDIHHKGLTPDVPIPPPENLESDEQMASAIKYMKDNFVSE